MRVLDVSKNIVDTYTQGYFSSKRHFRGELVREILITLYDTVERTSDFGYMYLCEGNVVIYLQKSTRGYENSVCELEQSDTLREVSSTDEFLKAILNQSSGAERVLNVKTTGEISYIFLNERYIILCNIQADLALGSETYNLLNVYLTADDFREKVRHTIGVMNAIILGEIVDREGKLLGISGTIARMNIILVLGGFVFALIFLLAFPFMTNWVAGLITWGLVGAVFFVWYRKRKRSTRVGS